MKNKIYLVLTLLVAMLVAGCGKETTDENTTSETPVVEESENSEEEDTTDVSDSDDEEIIGDVDITSDITIDDCIEMTVGSDLVLDYDGFEDTRKAAWESFGRNDIKLLFPKGEYIINQDNSNNARSEKVGIKLTIESHQQHIENKAGERTVFENENYLIKEKEVLENTSSLYTTMYLVYQQDTDNWLMITIEINKFDTEYTDNFIKDYIPRFEEVLISNFQ